MAERPIIFSAPMVRAILAGRKTMTRRLAISPLRKCELGDLLWVRETWADVNTDAGPALLFRADSNYRWCEQDAFPVEYERYPECRFAMWGADLLRGEPGHTWRSPIHMPRWASRITLEVTAVKIERLQEITEEDAIAKGCAQSYPFTADNTARKDFRSLWREIHGADAWEANPEVVVITFRTAQAARLA